MKAMLINTENRTVTNVEINDYKEIYELIGNGCHRFSRCPDELENGDVLYCDDDGLFNEIKGGMMMDNWHFPIVGNVVVQGTDFETGDSIDCKTTVEELQPLITWVSKENCERWADNFR